MSQMTPREAVEAYFAAFHLRDVDTLIDLYAPDATLTDVGVALLLGGAATTLHGRSDLRLFFTQLAEASPEGTPATLRRSLVGEGPLVAVEFEEGDTSFCEVFEVRDGRIQAQRTYWGSIPPAEVLERLLESLDAVT